MKLNAVTFVILCLALVMAERARAAPAPLGGRLGKGIGGSRPTSPVRGRPGDGLASAPASPGRSPMSSPESTPGSSPLRQMPLPAPPKKTLSRINSVDEVPMSTAEIHKSAQSSSIPYGYQPWKGRPAGLKQVGTLSRLPPVDPKTYVPPNALDKVRAKNAPAPQGYPRPDPKWFG